MNYISLEEVKPILEQGNSRNYSSLIVQKQILSYLKSGNYIAVSPGIHDDIITGKLTSYSGGIMTDGEWFWDTPIAYYFEKYNLSLSEEFLRNMKQNAYTVPHISETNMLNLSLEFVRKRIRLERKNKRGPLFEGKDDFFR